jgi:hypothetical protein
MGRKFYAVTGEGDTLSPKLLKISKESTEDRQRIYIPELRLTVYTRYNETVEKTKERYLKNTFAYKAKLKALSADH